MDHQSQGNNTIKSYRPTAAYIGASWAVMLVGVLAYLIGLWNATTLQLSEKGYYFAVLALGLYAAISLQKTLRDKSEGIPTTDIYYMISWAAFAVAVILMMVGLYNAETLTLSERGFYVMSFTLSLFAAVTVQKNTRDLVGVDKAFPKTMASSDVSSQKERGMSSLFGSKTKPVELGEE
ncbi:MAG: inner membrane protein YiaA [Psychrobacter sp.]|nr:inner membrane protein YiaA [Psychrobacter sp.]